MAFAAAEGLLIRFDRRDLDRIHELNSRNQAGQLAPAEQVKLEQYGRASFLLDLLHSRARRALKATRGAD